jgi:hypothetical protein
MGLPAADLSPARLRLTLFDTGADGLSQAGRIPLIGHGQGGPLGTLSSRASNLQLTRSEPRFVAISFPVPPADLRGKTALCSFQPLDFQISVPCGTLEIW